MYEQTDGNLYIEVMYNVEYEIEFFMEERNRLSTLLSDSLYDDLDIIKDKKNNYTYKYREAEITFGIEASHGQVTNIELVSTYL